MNVNSSVRLLRIKRTSVTSGQSKREGKRIVSIVSTVIQPINYHRALGTNHSVSCILLCRFREEVRQCVIVANTGVASEYNNESI